LPSVARVLNRLSEEGLSRTLLIGAGDAAAEVAAERRPWALGSEARDVADIDIGIQPLGASAFDQRKSGWKVYQYMAAGRPVVAHRAAFINELIADGATGFIVDTPEAFEARLRQLIGDQPLRRRLGEAAQASIVARFDLEAGADALAALFRKAVETHRAR
jgi:glycosyltransferase involved in cell wall biosynthesis